jgi:hypothetical protein
MKVIRPWMGFAALAAACAGPTVPPPSPTVPEKVVTAPATAPAPEPKAAPEPKTKAAPKPAPAPEPAKPAPGKPAPPKVAASAPALDLRTLEQRLKDTSAIGVLTKLSLKNQVDDLVGKFKTYHAGARPPTLSELKPSFDLLLMKVLSLLQDKDASLAREINASRDAIWGVLTDKQKLAEFS